jgi:hypothetical protein
MGATGRSVSRRGVKVGQAVAWAGVTEVRMARGAGKSARRVSLGCLGRGCTASKGLQEAPGTRTRVAKRYRTRSNIPGGDIGGVAGSLVW